MLEQLCSQLPKNQSPQREGQAVGTLLRMKRPAGIAAVTEGAGRHGPSRGHPRAGKRLEEGQTGTYKNVVKNINSSEKSNSREL